MTVKKANKGVAAVRTDGRRWLFVVFGGGVVLVVMEYFEIIARLGLYGSSDFFSFERRCFEPHEQSWIRSLDSGNVTSCIYIPAFRDTVQH